MSQLKQNGFCNTCERETGDITYIFCSSECQRFWILLEEKQVGKYDIAKEVYIQWLNDKTPTVESMTPEQIEARILEVKTIQFFAEAEWALLHKQWDKITGRKGIAPWLRAERDKLITDPNIKVDWDGEPRKKEKKPKEDSLQGLLGMDIKAAMKQLKDREKNPNKNNGPAKDIDAALLALASIDIPPEKPKLTPEEVAEKNAALKEKMRLAKERRESGS